MFNSILNWDSQMVEKANSLVGNYAWLDKIFAYLGMGLVYLVPVILIGMWFYSRYAKQPTLQILLSGILPWFVFNKLFQYFIWYRPRPYTAADITIQEVLFHRPDYSFPSDHATLLAAVTVAAFLAGYKKVGWWFLSITILVGIMRVITGVHYPLDIIAGVVSGTLGAYIVYWLRGPLTKYVYNPIINLAKKIHLA